MRLAEPFYKKVWKFFFQSEEARKKEIDMCNEAQRKYYELFANSAPFTSSYIKGNDKKDIAKNDKKGKSV